MQNILSEFLNQSKLLIKNNQYHNLNLINNLEFNDNVQNINKVNVNGKQVVKFQFNSFCRKAPSIVKEVEYDIKYGK